MEDIVSHNWPHYFFMKKLPAEDLLISFIIFISRRMKKLSKMLTIEYFDMKMNQYVQYVNKSGLSVIIFLLMILDYSRYNM
jgi:hypothetical protein